MKCSHSKNSNSQCRATNSLPVLTWFSSPQAVPDASPMKRSASTVAPQRPQEVNLRDYTLERPSHERPHHHHHHHHRCHHRRERDKDREKRQRSLDTPVGGLPAISVGELAHAHREVAVWCSRYNVNLAMWVLNTSSSVFLLYHS